MKRFLSCIIFSLIFALFSNTAFAEKQEWFDKSHDFTKEKRIFITLNIPGELRNGITENETSEIFSDKLQKKVIAELPGKNYVFKMFNEVEADIRNTRGINLSEMYLSDPQKAQSVLMQHVSENFDMFLTVNLMIYDTGTEYQEGYYFNAPAQQTSLVTTPYGTATVTTQGTQQQYVPGGNIRVAYACVKFMAFDVQTGKLLWSKVDDRAKAVTKIRNTQPKDLYGRIVSSFLEDLKEKLSEPVKK